MSLKNAKFQFPSNGKAYPKGFWKSIKREYGLVSIPFKRESVSKDLVNKKRDGRQFSIPFKRESVSKETPFCT